MTIIPELEEVLQKEFNLSLQRLTLSESLYVVNFPLAYKSRLFTTIHEMGAGNKEGNKPKKGKEGIIYAQLMQRYDDKGKILIPVWSILGWKEENYVVGIQFYTNDESYLVAKQLRNKEMSRTMLTAALHYLGHSIS